MRERGRGMVGVVSSAACSSVRLVCEVAVRWLVDDGWLVGDG